MPSTSADFQPGSGHDKGYYFRAIWVHAMNFIRYQISISLAFEYTIEAAWLRACSHWTKRMGWIEVVELYLSLTKAKSEKDLKLLVKILNLRSALERVFLTFSNFSNNYCSLRDQFQSMSFLKGSILVQFNRGHPLIDDFKSLIIPCSDSRSTTE